MALERLLRGREGFCPQTPFTILVGPQSESGRPEDGLAKGCLGQTGLRYGVAGPDALMALLRTAPEHG